MKELFITIGYYLLALLEGILYLLFWALVGGPFRLWEKWCYAAQCLRYPPPTGGMWGNMAREFENKPDKPDRPDRPEDDPGDYQLFQLMHRDLVPNAHVKRLLLTEFQRDHENLKAMMQKIRLRRERRNLLGSLKAVLAEKLLDPRLIKWFNKFDCLRFSEKLVRGDPEILKYAEAKFLRSGCGTTRCGGNMLIVDITGEGKMRQVFAKMLELAEPESYEFKGENAEEFFAPFMPVIKAEVWNSSEYVLKSLLNDPKAAAIFLLAQRQWRILNMYSKMAVDHHAKKFDGFFTGKDKTE